MLGALGGLSAACVEPAETSTSSASASDSDGMEAEDPAESSWVVQRLVEGPDGRTAFIYVTPPFGRLDQLDQLDDTKAREVSGNGRLYVHAGAAYIGDAEAMTVVRTRPEDGILVDDSPVMSLALSGLTFLPNWSAELTEGRGLFIDSFQGLGVVWDHQNMEILGMTDLSAMVIPPFEAIAESGVVRGDELLVPMQQTDPLSFSFLAGLQVAVISRQTGEIVQMITDSRCTGTRARFQATEDGTLYLLADNHGYAASFVDDPAGPTCVLRIEPGQTQFDPSYQLSLPEVLGGRDARALVYWKDGLAYVSVKHDEDLTFEFWDDPVDFGNQRAGHWWELNLTTQQARPLDLPAHGLLSSSGQVVDDRLLLQNPSGQLSAQTVIWEVLDDGSTQERLRYSGLTPVIAAL
ncbi:MAG: hypothetical protein AAGF11_43255 [Myxococcota bacterium]